VSGGAGALDRPVRLLRRVVTSNSYGEEVEGWPAIPGIVWAEFTPVGGGESFQADQRTSKQPATFKIRWRAEIAPGQIRVAHDGEEYEIEDVAELGRREYLLLSGYAREVQSGD
jgi:SPP1 family predicted phage head-tail adaptor